MSARLVDLTARARWQLAGADRVRYLNGQITRDVRQLTPARSELACVLDAKGRLAGDAWISVAPEFLRIDAEAALRDTLGARLERYIIADDAELTDVTDETAQFHVLGVALEELRKQLPEPRLQLNASQRLGEDGVDVFAPRALAAMVRDLFPAMTPEETETRRIERGLPKWGAELSPETLPAEAGLDATAIDFAKGCYLGQEVVSRIRSIGHVNKQLSGFAARDGELLPPGTRLFADASSEREAAWITSATWSFALSRPIALGYVRRGTTAPVLVTREPGAAVREIEIHPLPFTALA